MIAKFEFKVRILYDKKQKNKNKTKKTKKQNKTKKKTVVTL